MKPLQALLSLFRNGTRAVSTESISPENEIISLKNDCVQKCQEMGLIEERMEGNIEVESVSIPPRRSAGSRVTVLLIKDGV